MERRSHNDQPQTFGDHLEVLRQMLFRILAATAVAAVVVFCLKEPTWRLLLAPADNTFCTYRWIEQAAALIGLDFHFQPFRVELIATALPAQFMTHVTTAVYLGLLAVSPYILYELFRFVAPALYANEYRYSKRLVVVVYAMFLVGVLMSYFVLFPVAFRFLGTYSVAERVVSHITIDSYVDTFVSLTLLMALVFQLPVVAFVLGKLHLVSADVLGRYRRHALIVIMVVAAVITPPDLMTLLLVTIPLYLLYEISIRVVRATAGR